MADVYKFKVKLREMEEYIWRDIEITSVSIVSKLGYAILAAFEAEGSHLFIIKIGFCFTVNGGNYSDLELECVY